MVICVFLPAPGSYKRNKNSVGFQHSAFILMFLTALKKNIAVVEPPFELATKLKSIRMYMVH